MDWLLLGYCMEEMGGREGGGPHLIPAATFCVLVRSLVISTVVEDLRLGTVIDHDITPSPSKVHDTSGKGWWKANLHFPRSHSALRNID